MSSLSLVSRLATGCLPGCSTRTISSSISTARLSDSNTMFRKLLTISPSDLTGLSLKRTFRARPKRTYGKQQQKKSLKDSVTQTVKSVQKDFGNSGPFSGAKKKFAQQDTGITKAAYVHSRSAKDLIKPALFTVGFCGTCLAGSVIWQEQSRLGAQERFREFLERQGHGWRYDFGGRGGQQHRKAGSLREQVHEIWESMSPGQRCILTIIAVNTAVYLAWKAPVLRTAMDRFFLSSLYMKHNCQSMLWSTFSHKVFIHLGINMYVLNSFGPMVIDARLGVEQFVGFYCAAGVVSSLVGCAYKLATGVFSFSLGASGAILAVLSYTLIKFPDIQLQLVFLPFFTFGTTAALGGIFAFDVVGILLGWKLFDHAAHLGGTLFGLLFALYGDQVVERCRPSILLAWKSLRDGTKGPPGER